MHVPCPLAAWAVSLDRSSITVTAVAFGWLNGFSLKADPVETESFFDVVVPAQLESYGIPGATVAVVKEPAATTMAPPTITKLIDRPIMISISVSPR